MVSITELIAQVPLFSSLSEAQIQVIAPRFEMRTYKRGESIVRKGAAAKALYILISGAAQVILRDRLDNEVIVATLGPKDYVGEMSCMDGGEPSADVIVTEIAQVLVLSAAELRFCISNNPVLAIGLLQGLAKRLRAADEKIKSLALMDVYGRVARALLDSAVISTDATNGAAQIAPKISKQTLAKMIGASREMVTKVFKSLEKSGSISVLSDGRIQLNDRMMALL